MGVPKKTHFLGFLFITPLYKRARNNEIFFRIDTKIFHEIFYRIDTKIFQFDPLEVEKIGSKDGNPT